eukprot:Amastigsp_a5493_25.p5 type:complete len:102 gc:universal Amastigsp_a5493_25:1533-1838(+)
MKPVEEEQRHSKDIRERDVILVHVSVRIRRRSANVTSLFDSYLLSASMAARTEAPSSRMDNILSHKPNSLRATEPIVSLADTPPPLALIRKSRERLHRLVE